MQEPQDMDGIEIDYERVEILDASFFMRVLELEIQAANDVLAEGSEANKYLTCARAWKLNDGRLLIRRTDQATKELILPVGSWTLANDDDSKSTLH